VPSPKARVVAALLEALPLLPELIQVVAQYAVQPNIFVLQRGPKRDECQVCELDLSLLDNPQHLTHRNVRTVLIQSEAQLVPSLGLEGRASRERIVLPRS
jgi:hypothetical protein